MSRFRGLESKCFELHKHKLITDASFLRLTCKGRVKVIQMIQDKASRSTRITRMKWGYGNGRQDQEGLG